MRVCIFGAGAIGGFLAHGLAQVDGVELSIMARGDH
ncbi:MAG: oxidoreductase, partial [Rhizobiales bacterium]|nr:oxidoreductase [Hyphomicrobiales bacterium]